MGFLKILGGVVLHLGPHNVAGRCELGHDRSPILLVLTLGGGQPVGAWKRPVVEDTQSAAKARNRDIGMASRTRKDATIELSLIHI